MSTEQNTPSGDPFAAGNAKYGAEQASPVDSAASRAEAIGTAFAAAPAPTDHAAMREYLHTLAGLSLHLLFIDPDTKRPNDFRPRRRRSANRDYRSVKHGGGSAGERAPNNGGVYLATDDTAMLDRNLTAYTKRFGAHSTDRSLSLRLRRGAVAPQMCCTATHSLTLRCVVRQQNPRHCGSVDSLPCRR